MPSTATRRAARVGAAVFGLNAISDGYHVVLPVAASRLAACLARRGFEPVPADVGELHPRSRVARGVVHHIAGMRATSSCSRSLAIWCAHGEAFRGFRALAPDTAPVTVSSPGRTPKALKNYVGAS